MRLNKWINNIAESGLELLRKQRKNQPLNIDKLCYALLSNKGEAMAAALAGEAIQAYRSMPVDKKLSFFQMLLDKYNPDPKQISQCAHKYAKQQNRENLKQLIDAVESPRQNLIR